MPTLNWIGKKAIENHHRQVPFHLLKDVPDLSVGDPGSGNLLVEGDNLLALKALLPYYAGQIKCIYIDPPYNTGNEAWVYNDNVNSPEIRQWLGKVVGDELEDLTRHDKWLCMMYPRLSLLKKMLRSDGFICVQIDDSEAASLKMLLDEIFGGSNYLTSLYVQVRYAEKTLKQDMSFHKQIEQVLIYRRTPKAIPKLLISEYSHDKFSWYIKEIGQGKEENIGGKKVIIFPSGSYSIEAGEPSVDGLKEIWASGAVLDGNSSGRFFRDFLANRTKKDGLGVLYKVFDIGEGTSGFRYFTGPKKTGATRGKYFQGVPLSKLDPTTTFKQQPIPGFYDMAADFGNCRHEGGVDFKSGKKPLKLLKMIFSHFAAEKDALIMDSFAGSGSTGHATIEMNKDEGKRKFVLVEMDQNIFRNVTAKRLRNACEQEKESKINNGFRCCVLGEPLFDEKGNIRNTVRFAELARHVYFTETGEPLPKQSKTNSPLLGIHNGVGVYLLYNGILKDKSPDGGNVLTASVLPHLPKHVGPKVIYGTACKLGVTRLRQQNITFKQLPYKLKVDAL